MGETNVLFSIGPLEVTGAVVTMWVIVAVLALVSWLATRKLRDVPGPLQNAAEMAVEKLQGFYGGIMGPANARRYFPMMATFFIFIVVSNYIGLLPGAGQVFTVPTATLSVTAGLAIIAFCMTHTVGIQRRGLAAISRASSSPSCSCCRSTSSSRSCARFLSRCVCTATSTVRKWSRMSSAISSRSCCRCSCRC